ncbi:MAG: tRNA pseudouridine(55) synthase TruB, partial [Solirubrobacterales bacterium]|nr:tRNA pseudouridine(55) synthase TruB [Solirubrobacterales bacterium]
DLGDAYCEQLRRTAIGDFRVEDADPDRVMPLADALAFLPTVMLDGDAARRAAHGVAVPRGPDPGDGPVLLVDEDGPIAIAERRDQALKPIVGFRA